MTTSRANDVASGPVSSVQETLRLVATLPAPEGLVERVQQGLRAAPRPARLWRFPAPLLPASLLYANALRGAAAAAIVCVVAGGSWRIYSHVQPAPAAAAVTTPARIGSGGGFSSAGAMRTPDTLNGPVLTRAIMPPAQPAATVALPASPAPATVAPGKKHKRTTAAVPVVQR